MEPDADAKGASGANSGTASSFTARFMGRSSPPVQDHLIHLLAQRLHVGIGKASVQRAHAVGVVARATDRVAQIVETYLAGLAGGSGRTVVAAWNADGEADVAAIKAHAHGGRFTRIQGVHRIDDCVGKGRALSALRAGAAIAAIGSGLALDAVIAAWDVEGEMKRVSSHTHGALAGLPGSTVFTPSTWAAVRVRMASMMALRPLSWLRICTASSGVPSWGRLGSNDIMGSAQSLSGGIGV